jgi:hypothetical protein
MGRLNILRHEFEDTERKLQYPWNVEEFYLLKERREAIRREAQALAKQLNLPGHFWFNTAG